MTSRAALVAGLVAAALLATAPAALACPDSYTTPTLARWGDTSQFSPVPGGSFESSDHAWTVSGPASLVPGGNPRAYGSSSAAMRLSSGASVTSAPMCLDVDDRYLRLVADAEGARSHLTATVLWTDGRGNQKVTPIGSLDSSVFRFWSMSPALRYGDAKPPTEAGRSVRIRFSVTGPGASWTLDDVSNSVSWKDACPLTPTAQAFAAFGDYSDYSEVPGGLFDDAFDWDIVGHPSIVSGGYSSNGSGASAALLQSGDSITSQIFCIDRLHPHMRYVRRLQQRGGRLRLVALWTDDDGKQKQTDLDDDKDGVPSWIASRIVDFKDALPRGDGARHVRLRFSVDGKLGAWLLDDVYVDPHKRG